MDIKRLLNEIEQGIRIANREIIHAHIPTLNKNTVLGFAVAIARLRATYLDAAFGAGASDTSEPLTSQKIDQMRIHREAYEESRKAFEALRYALEQGYVDLDLED
ncbi:MAG: hypothetical protein JKY92_05145 [Magnetovibrio sp.]|nr:hypothetical protein [Magnetovibrio sp.]